VHIHDPIATVLNDLILPAALPFFLRWNFLAARAVTIRTSRNVRDAAQAARLRRANELANIGTALRAAGSHKNATVANEFSTGGAIDFLRREYPTKATD
jgi:hypothetical protein